MILTVPANTISEPMVAPRGSLISVKPGAGATARVECTSLDNVAAVRTGTATWAPWRLGTVGAAATDLLGESLYIRVVAQGGSVVLDTDESPSASKVAAFRSRWGGVVTAQVGPLSPASAPVPSGALQIAAVRDIRPFCEMSPGVYIVAASFAKQLATFTGDIIADNMITSGGGNAVVSPKFNWNDTTGAQGLYNNDGTTIISGANASIQQVWRLSTGTMLMFSVSHHATPAFAPYYLHRVASNFDCGTSANNRRASLHFGATDVAGITAPTPGVRVLHQRSLCEYTKNDGTKVVLVAEYNVANAGTNAPRTAGGANDQLTLWQSTDDGCSFSRVVQFNTGGVRRYSHFHGVVYNKYTRRVYMLLGDIGDENAVIMWDGESAVPNGGTNPTHAQIAAAPGWAVMFGNELCRYGDLIFTPAGDIVGLPDSDSNPELLGNATLSIPAKNLDAYVACKITHRLETVVAGKRLVRYKNIPPLIGLLHSSGVMVYGSLRTPDNGAGGNNVAGPTFEPYHWFWTSVDGSEWSPAAKIRNFQNAATGNVLDLWEDSKGNVIAGVAFARGSSWGAANRTVSCAIFRVSVQPDAPTLVVDQ